MPAQRAPMWTFCWMRCAGACMTEHACPASCPVRRRDDRDAWRAARLLHAIAALCVPIAACHALCVPIAACQCPPARVGAGCRDAERCSPMLHHPSPHRRHAWQRHFGGADRRDNHRMHTVMPADGPSIPQADRGRFAPWRFRTMAPTARYLSLRSNRARSYRTAIANDLPLAQIVRNGSPAGNGRVIWFTMRERRLNRAKPACWDAIAGGSGREWKAVRFVVHTLAVRAVPGRCGVIASGKVWKEAKARLPVSPPTD